MSRLRRLFSRLYYVCFPSAGERELSRELAAHLALIEDDLRRRGLSPEAAQLEARRVLGGVERARDRHRDERSVLWIDDLRRDVRFAARTLFRNPGFTAVAVLTLALGIGANSAIFALADAVLLRPLPFPDAERLVLVEEFGREQSGRSRVELLNFREWTVLNRSFEAMAGVWVPAAEGGPAMMGSDGTPESVSSQTVTTEFFGVLGVAPIAGRTFQPADESIDPDVVVLSERFWRTRFAADPALVGAAITLDGKPYTVIGIVPALFEFAQPASVWMLLPLPREAGADIARGQCGICRLLQVVGRLEPGVSMEAARSDLAVIANNLAVQNRDTRRPRRVTVEPLRDVLIGRELRVTSMLLLGVVGFVLLLCCANVANLLLARATVRRRELAVRSALGAGRRRMVAQLLTESLVLAALGGLLGLGLGAVVITAAPALVPAGLLPGAVTPGVDVRVVAFCAAVAVGVGLLFGLAPAWHVTGVSLREAMSADNRTATAHGGRLRQLLVAGEVAVAVLVLCGAGLLMRTLLVVEGVDHGYRAGGDRVLTANVTVPALTAGSRYPSRGSLLQFFDDVERELAAIPGVSSAAWATTLPMGGSQIGRQAFEIVGDPPPDARPQADYQIVSTAYFRTLDLPIVAGRPFTSRDTNDGMPVCIVSEGFVARHLQGRNPIGVRLSIAALAGPVVREIVGVARQVKERPDETESLVQIYVPNGQAPWPEAYLVVRAASSDAAALAPAVRVAIARVDKRLPVDSVTTLEDVAGTATARHRFRATLVLAFAVLALLLAMVGVFGVLAYAVQQRRREFGVRLALGATPSQVVTLVAMAAARVIAIGTAVGLVAGAMIGRSIETFLFGVPPLDPVTFAAVALVVAVTAAVACAVPAMRAASTDPLIAIRYE